MVKNKATCMKLTYNINTLSKGISSAHELAIRIALRIIY